jgi:hypothetical protein
LRKEKGTKVQRKLVAMYGLGGMLATACFERGGIANRASVAKIYSEYAQCGSVSKTNCHMIIQLPSTIELGTFSEFD